METNVLIGLICTIVGAIIAYATLRHNFEKDTDQNGRETGAVLTELGYIKGGIDDLKAENREQRKTNTELLTRITSVEESTKQAHRRIDSIESKVD